MSFWKKYNALFGALRSKKSATPPDMFPRSFSDESCMSKRVGVANGDYEIPDEIDLDNKQIESLFLDSST